MRRISPFASNFFMLLPIHPCPFPIPLNCPETVAHAHQTPKALGNPSRSSYLSAPGIVKI